MEGLLGFLVIVVICSLCVRTLVSDSAYAVRGQIPPRIRLRMAELQKTGRLRYGFWDYLRDLLSDTLEARRKRRAENPGPGPLRAFLGKWWAQRWDDAWDRYVEDRERKLKRRAAKRAAPDEPAAWRQRMHDWADWFRNLFHTWRGRGRGTDPTDEPGTDDAAPAPAGGGTSAPGNPSGGGAAPPNGRPGTPLPTWPPLPPPGAPATTNGGGQPLAPVIPINREVPPMSDAPEVTGLGSAIQYANGMSEAHKGQVGNTESFVASLQGGGVSGEAVAAATAAQEASAAAAAAWERCDQVLTSHTAVGEAYASNPGAGEKGFVTGE